MSALAEICRESRRANDADPVSRDLTEKWSCCLQLGLQKLGRLNWFG